MLDSFFSTYPDPIIDMVPDSELIKKYEDVLPPEILFIWKNHGFGSYMKGYFRFVNPELYQNFIQEAYLPIDQPIVFAATAFADLFLWEDNNIVMLNLRMNKVTPLGEDPETFFEKYLINWPYVSAFLKAKLFPDAHAKLGPVKFDECYAHVPALALGGNEDVAGLLIVKMREHVSILSGLIGPIGV